MKPHAAKRTPKSSQRRKRVDLSVRRLCSVVTNGTSLFVDIDHRSPRMRRLRDLIALLTSDRGGESVVSEGEKVLIRRAAMLTLQVELLEQRFAENEGEASPHQLELYQRTSNSLRRLLESLGLKRTARDITPTLAEYARSLEGEAA